MERPKNTSLKISIAFLVIIYLVGLVGLKIESTQTIFKNLVPLNILLSVLILLFFHKPWTWRSVLILSLIFLLGFFIEYIGVNTGKIFGDYSYGSSLGWKLFNTPLVIGLNWLLLAYIASVAIERIGINSPWKELIAAFLMTVIDRLIEPVANNYDFWHWQNEMIPLQNYMAWFCISLGLQALLSVGKAIQNNPVAIPLLIIQILFFISLNV